MAWRKWFAPRELKSRTVHIGSRYQVLDKQKNQVKNEIRNQVSALRCGKMEVNSMNYLLNGVSFHFF
jgi:hypothetical protein